MTTADHDPDVSFDTAVVPGTMSRMFGGSGNTILIKPFCRRLLKSVALSKASAVAPANAPASAAFWVCPRLNHNTP